MESLSEGQLGTRWDVPREKRTVAQGRWVGAQDHFRGTLAKCSAGACELTTPSWQ